MSIGLENLANVTAVSAAYPWKDIKDDTGAGDGTPLNQISHSDYHQTFRKLLALAGITPNGLPDNATNGYQYVDAILSLAKRSNGVITTATGVTLVSGNVRKIIVSEAPVALITHTLPLVPTLQDGDSFIFYSNSSFNVKIAAGGIASIMLAPDLTLLQAGDFVELVLDKPNSNWVIANYKITTTVTAPTWVTPTIAANTSIPSTLFPGPSAVPNMFEYRINNQNQLEFRGHLKITTGSSSMDLFELPVGILLSSRFIYALTTSGLSGLRINNTTGMVSAAGTPATNDLVTLEHLKINLD